MTRKQVLTTLLGLVLIAAMALVPMYVKKDSTINLIVMVLLYVSLASSWNILGGFAGQVNLGHAAFFGLGTLVTRSLWLSGWPL